MVIALAGEVAVAEGYDMLNWLHRKLGVGRRSAANPEEPLNRSGHEAITSPLDRRYRGRVAVGEEDFDWLRSAYSYGAASTVPGVISALKTLKDRVRGGETVWLFDPDVPSEIEITNRRDFMRWVQQYFPDISGEV